MRKGLEDFLITCICSRVEELNSEFIQNEEYKEVVKKNDEMYTRLKKELPEGLKEVFVEYSENNNMIQTLARIFTINRGF